MFVVNLPYFDSSFNERQANMSRVYIRGQPANFVKVVVFFTGMQSHDINPFNQDPENDDRQTVCRSNVNRSTYQENETTGAGGLAFAIAASADAISFLSSLSIVADLLSKLLVRSSSAVSGSGLAVVSFFPTFRPIHRMTSPINHFPTE